MVVEEMLAIEAHKLAYQTPIRVVRRRLDREIGDAEELGKIVKTQCQPTHHAEATAPAAFQRPEEIGVSARVRDANLAVGSNYFGFQQASRGEAVVLRETSKAAALYQTRHTHRRASAALNVFPAPGGNSVVCLHPDRSRAEGHRRPRL